MTDTLPPFPGPVEMVPHNGFGVYRYKYSRDQIEWIHNAIINTKLSIKQIASMVGVSSDSIYHMTSKNGWVRRNHVNQPEGKLRKRRTEIRCFLDSQISPDPQLIQAKKEGLRNRSNEGSSTNPIIGKCIGKTCVLFGSPSCLTSHASNSHRKDCDALF